MEEVRAELLTNVIKIHKRQNKKIKCRQSQIAQALI